MATEPTSRDLTAFAQQAPDEPVVMLNLLRFTSDGRRSYARYMREAGPYLEKHGGKVLYAGQGQDALIAEDGQAWDAVLVVHYPSRTAFTDLVADPGYQQAAVHRGAALSEAVLQPTEPWGAKL